MQTSGRPVIEILVKVTLALAATSIWLSSIYFLWTHSIDVVGTLSRPLSFLWSEKKPTLSAQPDIILLRPTHTYKMTWRTNSNLEMVILPNRRPEETEPLKTGLPAFQIKNLGSGTAKSVTIEWDAKEVDFKAAIHNSERLKSFVVKLNDTNFGIFSGMPDDSKVQESMKFGLRGVVAGSDYKGYVGVYSQNTTTQFPYMAPEINNTSYQDAVLPLEITHVLELFIAAAMPEGPPLQTRLSLPPLFATIRWRTPENGKPSRYRIDVTAISTEFWATVNQKPVSSNPEIEADVEFAVTLVDK